MRSLFQDSCLFFARRLRPLAVLLVMIWLVGCQQMAQFAPPTAVSNTPAPSAQTIITATPTAETPATAVSATTDSPPTTIPPSPTPNLDLPAWTLLIYMAADNNLAPAANRDLAALQAVAQDSPQVNVVVQVDGLLADGTAVRTDLNTLTLPLTTTQSLGTAVNSGDPTALTDFIRWGQTSYPAQHTALILWNHGLGWAGLASDDPAGDQLTLGELSTALQEADTSLASLASLASLDIIGFDACLMNQLDVLTAVAPYAHIAVASSELTPGTGWDYERLLRALYDAPQQTPPELAQTMVDSFMAYYTQDAPNDFVSLTAVDLTQLTAVTTALDTLSQHLQADLPFNAPALADARHGAASDLWLTADNRGQDSYTAVDVRDMADILASRSFDPAVISAAQELVATLDTAVLAHGRGRGLPQNNGLALYFPASASSLDPRYQSESQLATWPTLLSNFYLSPTAVSANAPLYPPTLDLINSFPEADANVLNPVHLAFQLTGRDLADVHILAGQFTADGRRRLLEYDRLIPQPTYLPNGRELLTWRDGRHTDFYIWQTRATVLTDGINRDFAILWPTGNERTLRRVPGIYTTAAGETLDAHLLFNRTNRSLATVWAVGPNGEPFEQTPASGDLFTPYRYYLDESDQLQVETGATFSVTTAVGDPLLRYDWQPVPDGNYFLGLEANNRADDTVTALTNIAVTNEQSGAATAEQFAYLDPYLGFQFPYPADWYRPVYGENGLYTTNTDGTAQLQLTLYPDTAASRPAELQADVLARFGQVDLLYEQDTAVGINPTIPAVMTAYGYNSGSGERTGLLVSFIHQGQGYVLDLDAPATAEPQAIALIDSITRNWQFRPLTTPQAALFPNNWNQVTLGEVAVPQRNDFRTQTAGAWERLAANDDPRIFMALQTHPLPTGAEPEAHSLADSLLYWSEVASQGVSGYRAGQLGRFVLANQLWVRQEFRYVDEAAGEEIWGFVMVTHVTDREVIAWAESPAAVYNEVNGKVFETMLAELALAQ